MWSQCPKGPNKTCFYKYQWWYLTFRRYILNGDTAPTYTEKGIYNKRLELRVKVMNDSPFGVSVDSNII